MPAVRGADTRCGRGGDDRTAPARVEREGRYWRGHGRRHRPRPDGARRRGARRHRARSRPSGRAPARLPRLSRRRPEAEPSASPTSAAASCSFPSSRFPPIPARVRGRASRTPRRRTPAGACSNTWRRGRVRCTRSWRPGGSAPTCRSPSPTTGRSRSRCGSLLRRDQRGLPGLPQLSPKGIRDARFPAHAVTGRRDRHSAGPPHATLSPVEDPVLPARCVSRSPGHR